MDTTIDRPLTDDDLAAIEQRAAAATVGPWEGCPAPDADAGTYCGWQVLIEWLPADWRERGLCPWVSTHVPAEDDAAFIAHARTDVPRLVAEVRRLKAELAEVKRAH